MFRYTIGIDEAGRGPLAGPVAVGVVLVPTDFTWDLIPGVGDSKKLSHTKREAIFLRAIELQKQGKLAYGVGLTSAKNIDHIGIVPSITKAMQQALSKTHTQGLCVSEAKNPRVPLGNNKIPRGTLGIEKREVLVLLDGGLKAPAEYVHQETIIKGDGKEKVIGLASIMAKVTRDVYMVRRAKLVSYAAYNFDIHKGYGTKAHREVIMERGLSKEHRTSFCKNLKK